MMVWCFLFFGDFGCVILGFFFFFFGFVGEFWVMTVVVWCFCGLCHSGLFWWFGLGHCGNEILVTEEREFLGF